MGSHEIFTTSTGPYGVISPAVRVLSDNSGRQCTSDGGARQFLCARQLLISPMPTHLAATFTSGK